MYLQQQQQQQRHLHYMRASTTMRPSPTAPGMTPRHVPETITVSDDDEEPPMSLIKRPPSTEKPKVGESSKEEENVLKPEESGADCSSKRVPSPKPFVPYREPESHNDVLISSASSFMPTFFLTKNDVKSQPETSKSEVDAIVPKVESEPARVIKEEPKDDFNVEVGNDVTSATTSNDENVAKNVKNEVDATPAINIEECADLLLSLAGSIKQREQQLQQLQQLQQPKVEDNEDVDIEEDFEPGAECYETFLLTLMTRVK
jgi:hypothetical protein